MNALSQHLRVLSPWITKCPERPFLHSCRSLIVRVGQELAESLSTAANQKSYPAAWRTSVVALNSMGWTPPPLNGI